MPPTHGDAPAHHVRHLDTARTLANLKKNNNRCLKYGVTHVCYNTTPQTVRSLGTVVVGGWVVGIAEGDELGGAVASAWPIS